MNVFLFQALIPSICFAFAYIFSSSILPENWYKLLIKFLKFTEKSFWVFGKIYNLKQF